LRRLVPDQPQESIDQHLACQARVLRDGGQRRIGHSCRRDIVKANHRHRIGDCNPLLLQRTHRPESDQITGSDDGVELHTAVQQLMGCFVSGRFRRDRIDPQRR